MALSLDASVGGSASTSYADVAAATAAAAYRVGGAAAAWLSLPPDQQIQTLVTATRDIDTVPFLGARATTTQALEWPRLGTGYSAASLPPRLVMATIEHAWSFAPALVAGGLDVLNPDTSATRIKEDSVGPITTVYFAPPPPLVDARGFAIPGLDRFSTIVQRLLAPLVRVAVSAYWGSAEAVRTS